jgi:hypothetical protein
MAVLQRAVCKKGKSDKVNRILRVCKQNRINMKHIIVV